VVGGGAVSRLKSPQGWTSADIDMLDLEVIYLCILYVSWCSPLGRHLPSKSASYYHWWCNFIPRALITPLYSFLIFLLPFSLLSLYLFTLPSLPETSTKFALQRSPPAARTVPCLNTAHMYKEDDLLSRFI
jgi:hypothetical protein